MNLLVSTNRKYLDKTETMIYSLSRYVSEPLFVWCLYGELLPKQRESFSLHLHKRCGISHIEFVNMDWVSRADNLFPINTPYLSRESYFRLFAQFFLPEALDRILWLDSDIIVKGSLLQFYHSSLDGIPLIAFSNMDEQGDNDKHLRRLGLSFLKPYFNAGVLLLNLNYLRTKTSMSEIIDFCAKNAPRLRFEDQDVMNLLYHPSAMVLDDQRFNCMVNAPLVFSSSDIVKNAVIIHFAGRQKPWKIQWQNEYSHYWWNCRREDGIRPGDRTVYALGWLWRKLDGHRWKRLLLKPYLWYADLKAFKTWK